MEGNS